MKREQALEALLRIVEDDRRAKCESLEERARSEARSILRAAHREARKRVRTALEEARTRARERVSRAEAQARTRERLARQRRLKAALEEGRSLVGKRLAAIWRGPAGRGKWIERSIERASSVLSAGQWDITHGKEWGEAERAHLAGVLHRHGLPEPKLRADEDIAAGLRIGCGHNFLDFTVDGLLADRAAIEARLLFHLEESST